MNGEDTRSQDVQRAEAEQALGAVHQQQTAMIRRWIQTRTWHDVGYAGILVLAGLGLDIGGTSAFLIAGALVVVPWVLTRLDRRRTGLGLRREWFVEQYDRVAWLLVVGSLLAGAVLWVGGRALLRDVFDLPYPNTVIACLIAVMFLLVYPSVRTKIGERMVRRVESRIR